MGLNRKYKPLPLKLVEALDAATKERSKSERVPLAVRKNIETLLQKLTQYSSPTEGDVVAGARLISEIGRGAFGTVWRAEDCTRGDDVAVKVFHYEKLAVELALHHFRRGVRIMRRLCNSSEAPPTMLRFLQHDEAQTAFAMEYFPNSDLVASLQLWTPEQRVGLFEHICSSVAFAHSKGVLHRDIKPKNILIRDDGTPVLADFDIADTPFATLHTQLAPGTYLYAAPEHSARPSSREFTIDVYSLGRVLQFLLLGVDPPAGMCCIPGHPKYDQILTGMLAHDPATRIQSVKEVLRMLPKDSGEQASVTPVPPRSLPSDVLARAKAIWAEACELHDLKRMHAAAAKEVEAIALVKEIDNLYLYDEWQQQHQITLVSIEATTDPLAAWLRILFRYFSRRIAMAVVLSAGVVYVLFSLVGVLSNFQPKPTHEPVSQTEKGTTQSDAGQTKTEVLAVKPQPSSSSVGILDDHAPVIQDAGAGDTGTLPAKATLHILDYVTTDQPGGQRTASTIAQAVSERLKKSGYTVGTTRTADEARFPTDTCRKTVGLYSSTARQVDRLDKAELRSIVDVVYGNKRPYWMEESKESKGSGMNNVERLRETGHVLILPSLNCDRHKRVNASPTTAARPDSSIAIP